MSVKTQDPLQEAASLRGKGRRGLRTKKPLDTKGVRSTRCIALDSVDRAQETRARVTYIHSWAPKSRSTLDPSLKSSASNEEQDQPSRRVHKVRPKVDATRYRGTPSVCLQSGAVCVCKSRTLFKIPIHHRRLQRISALHSAYTPLH